MDYRQLARNTAEKYGLDPNLVEATVIQESGGNPNAESKKKAYGVMQLMPDTAKELGVDPKDPLQNIDGGVRYLKQQIDKFGVAGGLAAYNAGAGRLQQVNFDYNKLPAETRDYVPKIMNRAAMIAEQNQTLGQPQTAEPQPNQPQSPSLDIPTLMGGYQKAVAAGDKEAAQEIGGLIQGKFGEALKKAQVAGDQEAVQEIQNAVKGLQRTQAPAAPATVAPAPAEAPKAFNWSQNAKTIYKEKNGKEFQGDDAAAEAWLKQEMSDLNNNLLLGGQQALKARDYSPEGKKALLDSMKAYDDTSITDVYGNVAKSILTDPTTYLGLGAGKVAGKVGQYTAKEALKSALEKSLVKRVASSTAAKVGTEGAVYAGVNNAIQQTAKINAEGQDGYNAGELAGYSALGLAGGAALGKITDRLTGKTALDNFIKRSGSEEGAKIDAEIVQQLEGIKANPNFRGQPVRAEQLNKVAQAPIDEAKQALAQIGGKNLAAQGADPKTLRSALDGWKAVDDEALQALRTTDAGNAVADVIARAQRVRSLTAEQEANGGLVKAARTAVDWIPMPRPMNIALRGMIGQNVSRKQTVDGLLKSGNVKAADGVLAKLGQSQASTAGKTLDDLVANAVAAQGAKPAKTGNVEKLALKREMDIAKRLQQYKAERLGSVQAQRAEEIAQQQLAAKGAQASQARDSLLANANQQHAQKRLADAAAARQQAAVSPLREASAALHADNTAAGVIPRSNKFNVMSQYTGMNPAELHTALDTLAASNPKLKPIIDAVHDRTTTIPDEAFYALQDRLKSMKQPSASKGILDMAQTADSGIRNQISYEKTVRTAKRTTDLAYEKAPTDALKSLVNEVAQTKDPREKARLLDRAMRNEKDDKILQYLKVYVEPLTKFGKKEPIN